MNGQNYDVRSDIKIEYFEDPVVERVEMVAEPVESSDDTTEAADSLWLEVYGKNLFSSGCAHISMDPAAPPPAGDEGKVEEAAEAEAGQGGEEKVDAEEGEGEQKEAEAQEVEKVNPQPLVFAAEFVEDKGCIRAKVSIEGHEREQHSTEELERYDDWRQRYDEGTAKAAYAFSMNGVDEIAFAFPFGEE